jgi:hypothetical protein
MLSPMSFKLTIETENAAFDDEPEAEVARILRAVAERLEIAGLTDGACYDVNGNRVGDFKLRRN